MGEIGQGVRNPGRLIAMPAHLTLSGKRVLVTGAAGAIGQACLGLFADLGASIIATDANEKALSQAMEGVIPRVRESSFKALDVTQPRQVDAFAADVASRFGKLDGMVLGAGIYRPQIVSTMSDQEWAEMLSINLTGSFHFCRAFAPHLAAGSAIALIASIAGVRGSQGFAHYAASKAGLLGLMRSLALELAPYTRVNAISPGPIEGPMIAPLVQKRGAELVAKTPLGRLGIPLDVAHAAAFLISDWTAWMTGENLQLNGGAHMD